MDIIQVKEKYTKELGHLLSSKCPTLLFSDPNQGEYRLYNYNYTFKTVLYIIDVLCIGEYEVKIGDEVMLLRNKTIYFYKVLKIIKPRHNYGQSLWEISRNRFINYVYYEVEVEAILD